MGKVNEKDINRLKERAMSVKLKSEALIEEKKATKREMKKLGLFSIDDLNKKIADVETKNNKILSKAERNKVEIDEELTKAEKALS